VNRPPQRYAILGVSTVLYGEIPGRDLEFRRTDRGDCIKCSYGRDPKDLSAGTLQYRPFAVAVLHVSIDGRKLG
jgi:hypothetical protein